jgi:hypothetical protein
MVPDWVPALANRLLTCGERDRLFGEHHLNLVCLGKLLTFP